MQRTLLIALATAVVAAGIATTATIVLTGDDEKDAVIVTPSPTATTTPAATAVVETASPDPGGEPTDGPGARTSPAATPLATSTQPTAKPGVTVRSAKSVDCDEEPRFCSSTDEMVVADDKLAEPLEEGKDPKSSSRPTVAMESNVWRPDKKDASVGDEVGSIHVEVTVSNSTNDTFVFAKREIVLEIFKDGKPFDSFSTSGEGFEMSPGSKMTGTFDRPITVDGTYTWRAKVWYYQK